jgi:hypothetical protein
MINILFSSSIINCLKIKENLKEIIDLENNDESTNLNPPKFSHESGFYANDFELKLSSEDTSIIYYTIDSTNPITSNTSQIYKDPILITDRTKFPNIYSEYDYNEDSPQSITRTKYKSPAYNLDKSMVIRAVVKNSEGIYSEIITNTYFITTDDLVQYQDLTVVSLVTDPENLFDPDTGIYVTGTQYINWKKSDEYDPSINPYHRDNRCNYFMTGKEWEREASVTIFEKGNIIVNQKMGIRIKGDSTRNNPAKSFNLYAREKYGKKKVDAELLENNFDINGNLIKKYKTFALRCVYEPYRLKEIFAKDLFSSTKILAISDAKMTILFLNGEYWGAYLLIEKTDKSFIETNYLIPSENVSMIKEAENEEGPIEDTEKFNSFCSVNSVWGKDLNDEKTYEEIKNFIDVDSLIEHYAFGIYIATGDWPQRNQGVWKNNGPIIEGNEFSDGKWRLISFDFDYTMGAIYSGVCQAESDHFMWTQYKNFAAPTNLFVDLFKKNKIFQNKFINVFCDFANEILNPIKVNKLVDEYIEKYQDIVAYSQLRWWGAESKLEGYATYKTIFLKESDVIKNFFEKRPKYSLQQLKEFLGLKEELVELNIIIKGEGKIKINNIFPELNEGKWSGKYFTNIPIIITAIPNEGNKFKEWSGDKASNEEILEVSLDKETTIIANFE